MLTVLIVFGTRPEAIKLAPVIQELRKYPAELTCQVCVTAQHRQMVDQVLDVFGIRPDYDLDIMTSGQTLPDVTSRVLYGLENVFRAAHPDLVLVQGDTTTVLATALTAYYHRISVGHVEAGLRTGDKYRPFPEEMNRRLTDALSDLCFAPTKSARSNLLREGVPDTRICVSGNTVIDALLDVASRDFGFTDPELMEMTRPIVLVTAHRRESFGKDLESICLAIRDLAEAYPEALFIYPVHLNPNVGQTVERLLSGRENIRLIEPLEYPAFVHLMKRSFLVLTDSGGIQEEAPSLNVPVLVMRDVTERYEAIETGTAKLVGTRRETIVREARKLFEDSGEYERMASALNPFGDGKAAERIARFILDWAPSLAG